MGGGHYDGDVAERSRSTRRETFTYRGHVGGDAEAAAHPERRECHPDMNVKGKVRECRDGFDHLETTPIFVAMDVTKSRGDDAKVVYGKMPMFIGQINMRGYVKDPQLLIAGIGDASSGDQAPIQVGQFESDNRIDQNLANLWLEEGGGGTGQESYELMAYVGAHMTDLDCNRRGKKGFFFFVGDEGFYPFVKKDQVKVWLGHDIPEDIPVAEVFRALKEKYHVFFIYPQKTWEERKSDIDAEIKQRVVQAGGMYSDVDIRFSGLWNNENDLDLHVTDPCGHHIYYATYCKSNMRGAAPCGGFLDVDMNVRGETTKPVENVRWPKGTAPPGKYRFSIQCYRTHAGNPAKTPFRAEIEINGKIMHFEGCTPAGKTGEFSDTLVYECEYQQPTVQSQIDAYAHYKDDVIKSQWAQVIGEDHILILEDPKGIIDLMMGAIAVTGDKQVDLDDYIGHMADRDQTLVRQDQTRRSLAGLAGNLSVVKVDTAALASKPKKNKKRKTERI